MSTSVCCVHATTRFSVLGRKDELQTVASPSTNDTNTTHASRSVEQEPKHEKAIRIFLDVDEPYTRRVILEALGNPSRSHYFTTPTLGPGEGLEAIPLPNNCDFQWSEYERINWDRVNRGEHGASSYCIRKGLSRKAQLAHYTHRHVCKHPDSVLHDAIPKTCVLDCWPVWEEENGDGGRGGMSGQRGLADIVVHSAGGDSSNNRRVRLDQCLAEAKIAMKEAESSFEDGDSNSSAPVWLLKGSTTNKGVGIHIVHLYEQVVDLCWSEPDIREWVLQRYIDAPLLLGKRKFHIRAYVVAVSSLRVYLYRQCLALCSGTRYKRSDTSNLFSHITNTAYQDLDPGFSETECVLRWDTIAPILLRDGTCRDADEAQNRIRSVVDEMGAIAGELFSAYQNEFGVFAPIEGCFEQYGLDFLIDDQWRVSLLEVNPGPDFKQTGDELRSVIEGLMGSTIDVSLIPLVTERACQDSGELVLVHEQASHPK